MRIVLASASPRRRELLGQLELVFEVVPAEVDEELVAGEEAKVYVKRLALDKARAVSAREESEALIIAADTIVEINGELLGKPADQQDARAMLRRLSGAAHQVHTGVAVIIVESEGAREASAVATTTVRFHPLSEGEIDWYVTTGEPMDKAGAYGIQAHGGLFVAALEGSYFNVVGLPSDTLYQLVVSLGVDWQELVQGERNQA